MAFDFNSFDGPVIISFNCTKSPCTIRQHNVIHNSSHRTLNSLHYIVLAYPKQFSALRCYWPLNRLCSQQHSPSRDFSVNRLILLANPAFPLPVHRILVVVATNSRALLQYLRPPVDAIIACYNSGQSKLILFRTNCGENFLSLPFSHQWETQNLLLKVQSYWVPSTVACVINNFWKRKKNNQKMKIKILC